MTKKRQVVKVNEEKLKMMMAGEIPRQLDRSDLTVISGEGIDENVLPEDEKDEPAGPSESIPEEKKNEEEKKPKKKKRNGENYESLFLSKRTVGRKSQRTISLDDDIYLEIIRLINIYANISFPNFINNVLANHIETYKDEIDKIINTIMNDNYK